MNYFYSRNTWNINLFELENRFIFQNFRPQFLPKCLPFELLPRTQTTGGRSRGRRLSDALLQVVPNLPQVTRPPVSKLARALAKAGLGDKHNGQPVSVFGATVMSQSYCSSDTVFFVGASHRQ